MSYFLTSNLPSAGRLLSKCGRGCYCSSVVWVKGAPRVTPCLYIDGIDADDRKHALLPLWPPVQLHMQVASLAAHCTCEQLRHTSNLSLILSNHLSRLPEFAFSHIALCTFLFPCHPNLRCLQRRILILKAPQGFR